MRVDPYCTLGVSDDATAEEIHRAYRRLARQVHPDTGCGDASEMARVNAAWRTLGDTARRAAYDTATAAWAPAPGLVVACDELAGDGDDLIASLRLLVVAATVLLLVSFLAIVLVGFGRVGVSPTP